MHKKRNTYILLIIMLLVWSLVVYRLVTANGRPDAPPPRAVRHGPAKPPIAPETYTIKADYRDPFLGTMPIQEEPDPSVSAGSVQDEPQADPIPTIDWSPLVYTGVIRNTGRKQAITLMNIHGTDVMLREGESYQGVKLVRNAGAYVTLYYQGELNDIYK